MERDNVETTAQSSPGDRVFLIYDRTTGRILHRHGIHRVAEESEPEDRQIDLESLVALLGEGTLRLDLVGGDRKALAMIEVKPDADVRSAMVDPKTGKLGKRQALKLTVDKRELNGDGKDSAAITIEVVDNTGATATDFSGEVKVTTTHGRLSTKGGLVKLKGGKGTVTLTATHETIDRVSVSAICRERPCSPARLNLAFL